MLWDFDFDTRWRSSFSPNEVRFLTDGEIDGNRKFRKICLYKGMRGVVGIPDGPRKDNGTKFCIDSKNGSKVF